LRREGVSRVPLLPAVGAAVAGRADLAAGAADEADGVEDFTARVEAAEAVEAAFAV